MGQRRPRPASHHTAIPAWGALLALGADLVGCHDPSCAESRAEELSTHGRLAVTLARRAQGAETARELAVATGLIAHPPATIILGPPHTVDPPIDLRALQPGAAPPVTVTPPPPPIEPIHIGGEPVPVGPRPPDRPHRRAR